MLKNWFPNLIIINLVLVFVVIAAGAIVRATGSGMGCPDWPRCFGKLIPPTHIDQITWHADEEYDPGEMIIKDETLLVAQKSFRSKNSFDSINWKPYEKHDYAIFNPLHTWVEFINRLATVVLGFPVMLMAAISLFFWRTKKSNVPLSIAVVLLIGFQAWLGKIVVDRNLQGTTITYHMIGVFAIIAVLVYLYHINRPKLTLDNDQSRPNHFSLIALISVGLTLLMVILGTQVREEIDLIAKSISDRSKWIDELSNIFVYHRSMVWIVLIANAWLAYTAFKHQFLKSRVVRILSLIAVEAVLGIVLTYLDMPAVAQPTHLFVAALLFALQFELWISARNYSN